MDTKKIFILIGVVFLAGCAFTVGIFLFIFLKPNVLDKNFDSNKSFQPVAELILPEQKGILNRTPFESISVINNYAYALTSGGFVYVYDVKDLSEIKSFKSYKTPVSMLDVKNERGLLEVEKYLYVFGDDGIEIIDTQNPDRLSIVYSLNDLDLGVDNLILNNEYLIAVGYKQVLIYRLKNSFTPELLTRLSISKDINGEDVIAYSAAIYEDILYVSTFYYYKDIGTLVYDITDISKPVFAGLTEGELAYHSLIVGDKLIQCTSEHVLLWSLAKPSKPILLSTVDAIGNVCQLVNNNFLITNGKVVKINDMSLQVESEFDESPFNTGFPQGSDIAPNYIFITQDDKILILNKQE